MIDTAGRIGEFGKDALHGDFPQHWMRDPDDRFTRLDVGILQHLARGVYRPTGDAVRLAL